MFGTIAQDNGDYMNPGRRGEVLMDPDFDMSSKEAQSWLYKFCMSIKKQPFYKYTHGDLQLSNCFIITFKASLDAESICTNVEIEKLKVLSFL